MLTEGNTLLATQGELEMLVILRMNRNFMEWARVHYKDLISKLANQHFGMTVVEAEEGESSPASMEVDMI